MVTDIGIRKYVLQPDIARYRHDHQSVLLSGFYDRTVLEYVENESHDVKLPDKIIPSRLRLK